MMIFCDFNECWIHVIGEVVVMYRAKNLTD